jgi:hypothetical protein
MLVVFKCVAPCSQTVFAAVSGEVVVGHVRKEMCEGYRFQWSWWLDVTGPGTTTVARPDVATSGQADSCEGAKAALTDNWSRWLAVGPAA